MPAFEYRQNTLLATVDIAALLNDSGIRRPTHDLARIERMLRQRQPRVLQPGMTTNSSACAARSPTSAIAAIYPIWLSPRLTRSTASGAN